MMTLYVTHKPEGTLYTVDKYFAFIYYPEWFDDQMVKDMIKDIDEAECISALQVISKPGIPMACTELSGGVKGLIMLLKHEDERSYSSVIWGANCVKWIAKLSFLVDFNLYMQHPLEFISGAELGTLPICAQGEKGEPLTTCREVWEYYADNCQTREN